MLATSEVGRKFSNPPIEREEWVRARTSEIYLSKHYRLDLVAYVLEGKKADKVFDALFEATSADYIEALSGFHAELLAEARKLAESEANVRFTYCWN